MEGVAMRVYSNPTTHRLEQKAKKLGCNCEIQVMEPSEEGHFFITRIDGQVLKMPVGLGWTDEQAIYLLKRRCWNRTLGCAL
jgi:hypothetical protein